MSQLEESCRDSSELVGKAMVESKIASKGSR